MGTASMLSVLTTRSSASASHRPRRRDIVEPTFERIGDGCMAEEWNAGFNPKTGDWEPAESPVIPDRGPAWATGYGIQSYDAERDLVFAWLQLHTNAGTVRLGYVIVGSVQTHQEVWPKVANANGYRLMPGPPLLDE